MRKAPAATVADLAAALIAKYGGGAEIPVRTIGIRPGEKVDEVLVNEYEIQRAIETDDYFTIYPEYRAPVTTSRYPVGYEYTSANTRRAQRSAGDRSAARSRGTRRVLHSTGEPGGIRHGIGHSIGHSIGHGIRHSEDGLWAASPARAG